MNRPKLILAAAIAFLALAINPVQARTPSDYWQDTKDYVISPLRWDSHDWTLASAVAIGIAGSYSLDDTVHDRMFHSNKMISRGNGRRDALPFAAMVAGTFAAGILRSDEKEIRMGWDMSEAVILASLSTQAFKTAFGRERPYESASPDRWGHGGASFPSGHTSRAFAAAQVIADELPQDRWGWRVLVYSLAGVTAYARLDSNAHWFSDTVAGAALGIATGRFVSSRSGGHESKLSLSVAPTRGGSLLTFSIDTN